MLALCNEHNIVDAKAYLAEKMGDPNGALEMLISLLPEKVTFFQDAVLKQRDSGMARSSSRTMEVEEDGDGVEDAVLAAAAKPMVSTLERLVGLCKRNSEEKL